MLRQRRWQTVKLVSVALLVAVAAWMLWWPPTARLHRPDVIVLVTIDTLRADHLGCYGYPRNTSPFIDWLADRGTRFTAAFAPMATTAASHASLFTSLYPLQHQVRKNGEVLNDRFLTLAEFLRDNGYHTAGFVSTDRHFKVGHLDQGFDTFDEPTEARDAYRPGNETVARAIEYVRQRPTTHRLFVWVHLFDPHAPYNPANRFVASSPQANERLLDYLVEQQHVDLDFFGGDRGKLLDLVDGYDGEVAAADRAVEKLFREIETHFSGVERLWIVANDHGEGLGNHRWLEHSKMIYNEQLHMVLIVYASSGVFAGAVVDRVVENVDIFPTVAALTGGSVASDSPMQGSSLLALLLHEPDPLPPKSAFAQRRDYDPRNRPPRIIPEITNYEAGEKYALQDGRYKYILRTEGDDEFYHLQDDPYEVHNLIGVPSADKERLHAALLAKVIAVRRTAVGSPRSVDAQTLERLRALGYEP